MARRRAFTEPPSHAQRYAVPMPDGVRLATDVYLPASGRGQVLLSRLPYDKSGAECFQPAVADWFTERGYVVVVQDIRGKLRSGGDTKPFVAEVSDGYHTLDWIVSQSWCAGAVGMMGDSYYGFTQWAAAASGHPALCAIAPRVASADFRQMLTRQGVFALEVSVCWALETWVDEALYEYDGQVDWAVRPQSEIAPTLLGGRRPVGLDDWAVGRFSSSAAVPVHGNVPTLHLGGFADFLLRGQLSTWRRSRSGRAADFLLLDARDHGWTPVRTPGAPYEDPQSSSATMQQFLDDYLSPLVSFFDHFLCGRGDYEVSPVRWRVDDGAWHEVRDWPPVTSRPVRRVLTRAGELAPDSARTTDEHQVRWQHDPVDPVPSLIHPYYPLIDPVDERSVRKRSDLLTFTAEAEGTDEVLAGPVSLRVWMHSSAPSAHLMATLYDLDPDGRTRRIVDGASEVSAPWPAHVELDLGTAGYRMKAGNRLCVTISGSSFPRYALHPGNGNEGWTTDSFTSSEHAIIVGGARGAQLSYHAIKEDPR